MRILFTNIIFYLCLLIVAACNPAKKAVRKQNYHEAVMQSIYTLQKNKRHPNQILLLEKNLPIANQHDLQAIEYLKNQNLSSNYEQIFQLYQRIQRRQLAIQQLQPLYIRKQHRTASFSYLPIDRELNESRDETLSYLYKKAIVYLSKHDRMQAREAYNLFQKILQLNADYEQAADLKDQALQAGTNYVSISLINHSAMSWLPHAIEDELLQIDITTLATVWTKFHVLPQPNFTYTHQIQIYLNEIRVSPEQELKRTYSLQKQINDKITLTGKDGKPLKDSLGNIKQKDTMMTVVCKIYEVEQLKTAKISGKIVWMDATHNQILKSVPIQYETVWQNIFAKAKGDLRALTPSSQNNIKNSRLPFPSNDHIAGKTAFELRQIITSQIQQAIDIVK